MTNPDFMDIGACVFDAYGTLFDFNSAVARGGGALGDKAHAVSQLWRRKQLEYTWLRSLMGTYADFWQITGEALDYALADQGVDDPALRESLMDLYLVLDAYPEVPETLAKLRAGGKVTAILSNGTPDMLASAATSAGIASLLDGLLSVDEIKVYKPDPRVYQLVVDRLGEPAERICFLSSNAWDAYGASHFGFRTAWVNRSNQVSEGLPSPPAARIKTLAELPALLGV